jgi:hypothetical protein
MRAGTASSGYYPSGTLQSTSPRLSVNCWARWHDAPLSPLAHARPPDPTRIAGFYDDADYDDVIQMLGRKARCLE